MSVGGSRKPHTHRRFVEGVVRGSHTCENEETRTWSGAAGEHYASEISDRKLPNRKDR